MLMKPFIHLFQTAMGYYCFDVNTDTIIKLSEEDYFKLSNFSEYTEDENIIKLKRMGLLKPNKSRISMHPEENYLNYQFSTNLHSLVLQVTQNCNQRCDYCIYSGKYNNRIHNDKRMSFEIAKKGIDMILASSKDSESLFFGFYGGEPLLEKELIEQCLDYINENVEGKKIHYNITTNGTLLKGKIVETFVKNEVTVLISLDGPEEIHNKNRKFEDEKGNSQKIILENLKKIRDKYPEYYEKHISFNTVLDGKNGFKYINDFFEQNSLFETSIITSSLISDKYSLVENIVDPKYVEERKYAMFLCLLTIVGRLEEEASSGLMKLQKEAIRKFRNEKNFGDKKEMSIISHHSGNCIPGIHKLFMNVNGEFYPCEKISEHSRTCKIGSLDTGINLEKVKTLLNLEILTKEECDNCWAYDYCTMCLAWADNTNELSRELMLKQCNKIRQSVENMFKDYCVCKEIKRRYKI